MARTTSSNVQGILGSHYDGTTSLTPFIDTANSLVTHVDEKDFDGVLSSTELELIERWLAAHFYGHADQFLSQKNTGKAGGTFQGQFAMVFNSTQYGQAALALDVTGELARMQQQSQTGKNRVGMVWLGTRYKNDDSERTSDQ